MSRDSLKGTVSGVGKILPCSNATPVRRDDGGEDVEHEKSTESFRCTLTEVNVDQFCRLFINENVLDVPIAQANDVTHCQTQHTSLTFTTFT